MPPHKLKSDIDTNDYLSKIELLDRELYQHFYPVIMLNPALNRKHISFQANKDRSYYRLYKYKEAFSADLVEYLFQQYSVLEGKILDPFAGSGTALFACSSLGYDADGIELLPVGQKIIEANLIARRGNRNKLLSRLEYWLVEQPWNREGKTQELNTLRITDGAYPQIAQTQIGRYLYEIQNEDIETQEILLFALLSILESISYTRKDGQYLRWDHRADRKQGSKTFKKGKILSFDQAIDRQMNQIKEDLIHHDQPHDLLSLLQGELKPGKINLIKGSCLDILPQLKSEHYSGIMTSPPYCNRYDYTRTYALEHAVLGVNEIELVRLRQAMLTCTVENKFKDLITFNQSWKTAIDICNQMPLLQQIFNDLDHQRQNKQLNNPGIVRMVKGYFYEMACVIQDCYRVLQKDGRMFMVNDNVRYAGISISVDLLLSKIAEEIGFRIENIMVLPQGKGNSSQQMGKHGRQPLRKCIYVWKKES
ncbi:DNA methyltransferase [Roseofilum capinflatum]|uniref:site-specific DNA-methyltransferase (cytosine-N(4)-specific) n=1 Tax=Roseofilum capinflatum BLCC-M114 TaxID=3022440 RepID=A0ABT7B3N1_9CYAN|nr:DNA methyltransferase [Roseofilum capinflatum]MDJ1173788.1 site-specific DNA-methyltransferase [Roseofilum capinflatum BLCC-M114]